MRPALSAVALVLVAACASGPQISHRTNPAADFAAYRTFGYFSPLGTDRAGLEPAFTARLKESTRRALQAKGYLLSEAAPDLRVNFHANVQDRQDPRTTQAFGYEDPRRGYYGGFGAPMVEPETYEEGTLTVDLVDARRQLLVWQATAVGSIAPEARRNPGPAIDAVVDRLIAPLPAAKAR